jgi:hypothetical protein
MTTSQDFDFFLKYGYIKGLEPGSSMNLLLTKFGDNYWYVKEIENNGLIYGIIKIGFIEFHIYNEKISGVSYRPNLFHNKKDFKPGTTPWIYKIREIVEIEKTLKTKEIDYNKYSVNGPLKVFKTVGVDLIGLEDGEHTFIETEGGVTFLFDINEKTNLLETYQICKYYNELTTA